MGLCVLGKKSGGGGVQLVGTFSGNQTIDVSSYLNPGDTADNFLIEILSIASNRWTRNLATAGSGYSWVEVTASALEKTLSGTSLIVSSAQARGTGFFYGTSGFGDVTANVAGDITYRVWYSARTAISREHDVIVNLGTGDLDPNTGIVLFDVSSYPGHETFTEDNFIIESMSVNVHAAFSLDGPGDFARTSQGETFPITMDYNPTSGILTVNGLKISHSENAQRPGGGAYSVSASAMVTPTVSLIYKTPGKVTLPFMPNSTNNYNVLTYNNNNAQRGLFHVIEPSVSRFYCYRTGANGDISLHVIKLKKNGTTVADAYNCNSNTTWISDDFDPTDVMGVVVYYTGDLGTSSRQIRYYFD